MIVFCSDNGPSRETRNWLDGTPEPYRGGSTGPLKGHKFSLYDGGIRVPGIISWPGHIPAGQVVDLPCTAMDVLPTILAATQVDGVGLELDGTSLLDLLSGAGTPDRLTDRQLFWELGDQTAVREGRWKLVLNGQLVEGEPDTEEVFLADLEQDAAEAHNLIAAEPEIAARLTEAATRWRTGIEERWTTEWLPLKTGTAALAGS
jgi:arylsulfatase A-like enzyme